MMTPSLVGLDNEQSQLELPSFNYAMAWTLGLKMQLEASARSLPVAIEVSHGNTVVFFALLPGATPDNPDWSGESGLSLCATIEVRSTCLCCASSMAGLP